MIRIAIALTILLLSAPAAAVEPSGSGEDLERVARPPGVARSVYDAVVVRPLGFVQVVLGAVLFVPSYPVALLLDGDEDVFRVCIADPVERTFQRPLGRL